MLKRLQNSSRIEEKHDEPVEEPVRQTAGAFLRARREEFGYDLRDVAEQLRIRYVYLVAIEEDRLDDLPGATYAVGFVRAYAEYLRLNGPAMVERFKEETEELAKSARLVFPSPQPEGKVPSGAILLLSIIVVALVYGGWVFLSSKDRNVAELIPALPERFMALIGRGNQEAPADSAMQAPVTPQVATTTASPAPAPAPVVQKPEMPPVTPAPLKPVTTEAVTTLPDTASPGATDTANNADKQATEPPAPAGQASTPAPATAPEADAQPASPSNDVAAAVPPTQEAPATASPSETAAAPATPPSPPAQAATPAPAPEPAKVSMTPVTDGSPVPATSTGNTGDATDTSQMQANATALPVPPPPDFDSDKPRVYGAENKDARVVLRASEEVWVQVRDSEGNLLLTRLLRKGDTYRVPNDPGLVMRTGNAGGLDIIVDGTLIPRIGSKGAVLKDVALDADMLKAGTATRQQ